MIFYNRKEDGTTYYFINGILFGHPTNADGSCDFDENCETPVEEYAEPLTDEEIKDITNRLTNVKY